MQKLFTYIECQEENHNEEKEIEAQKNLLNCHKSDDDSLTINSLSAHQESLTQEHFKEIELKIMKRK